MIKSMSGATIIFLFFFFSSRRRHTRCGRDWSSDVCSSDLSSSFRSQPSAGTIGKTSCRLRNGASMYFTTCSADSVTWPSASMTVMVATSSRLLADHVEQGLALVLADHLQRAGERPGKPGRVFHALAV